MTLLTISNVYSYDRSTLWTAYGLSILLCAVASLFGITTIILSGASYSYQFSTILRVVKTSTLDTDIADEKSDGFGRDPLPKYLENAQLDIWGAKGDVDEVELHNFDRDGKRDMRHSMVQVQEAEVVVEEEGEGLVAAIGSDEDLQASYAS